MASIFFKSPVLYFVVVVVVLLCGRHAHGEGKAATVYDVTEYGAAPSNRDNKDVSAVYSPTFRHRLFDHLIALYPSEMYSTFLY